MKFKKEARDASRGYSIYFPQKFQRRSSYSFFSTNDTDTQCFINILELCVRESYRINNTILTHTIFHILAKVWKRTRLESVRIIINLKRSQVIPFSTDTNPSLIVHLESDWNEIIWAGQFVWGLRRRDIGLLRNQWYRTNIKLVSRLNEANHKHFFDYKVYYYYHSWKPHPGRPIGIDYGSDGAATQSPLSLVSSRWLWFPASISPPIWMFRVKMWVRNGKQNLVKYWRGISVSFNKRAWAFHDYWTRAKQPRSVIIVSFWIDFEIGDDVSWPSASSRARLLPLVVEAVFSQGTPVSTAVHSTITITPSHPS